MAKCRYEGGLMRPQDLLFGLNPDFVVSKLTARNWRRAAVVNRREGRRVYSFIEKLKLVEACGGGWAFRLNATDLDTNERYGPFWWDFPSLAEALAEANAGEPGAGGPVRRRREGVTLVGVRCGSGPAHGKDEPTPPTAPPPPAPEGSGSEEVPIRFLTVVFLAGALAARFPGGLPGFDETFRGAYRSSRLRGLAFMSGADLAGFLAELKAMDIQPGRDLAIGEMVSGEWQACPEVRFEPRGSGLPSWVAVHDSVPPST